MNGAGCEWVIEAHGCSSDPLSDPTTLRAIFRDMICDLDLHPVAEPLWHVFPAPHGITGVCLLSESHLAVHTFPEHGSLCLNLFCCRPRKGWDFDAQLRRRFGAQSVRVRMLERNYAAHAQVVSRG
jgi:S-adenosylmethionine decarboxylase